MQVPSYKYVFIKSDHKSSVFEQLHELSFGKAPYILDVSNLKDEANAISFIDEYVEQFEVRQFPYPVFIISNENSLSRYFESFSNVHECPQFFNQKTKGLSIKEQQLLNKLELKQKKLHSLIKPDYLKQIDQYAKAHKKIYLLTKENLFYENILSKLEGKNG